MAFAFPWGDCAQRARLWARGAWLCLAFLALLALSLAAPACAEETPEGGEPEAATIEAAEQIAREIWSGGENIGSTWAFYTGITAAIDDIALPGARLRLVAGMSTYAYAGIYGRARAAQPFADLLAGYQWQLGALTLKAFAGGTGSADIRTVEQALDLWGQTRIGAKVVGETWWRIDATQWASLDVAFAFASPQATLWSRARYGYRVLPQLSVGPEAGLVGEVGQPAGRAGGFARFDWTAGEVALSGGIAGIPGAYGAGFVSGEKSRGTPYIALSWLQRF